MDTNSFLTEQKNFEQTWLKTEWGKLDTTKSYKSDEPSKSLADTGPNFQFALNSFQHRRVGKNTDRLAIAVCLKQCKIKRTLEINPLKI